MTTNAGSREMETNAIGFSGEDLSDNESKGKKAMEKVFTPEFRNRLDSTIFFGKLPFEVIIKVVDKFLHEVEGQLADKHVELEVTEAAKKWFADNGYDEKFGARPMSRLIQNKLKVALADELLFGKLQHGGTAKVDLSGDEITVEVIKSRPPPVDE